MKDVDKALERISKLEQERKFENKVNAWIRVRCMAAGSVIVGAMWQLGSWAVENMTAITAAVKAFLAVKGGR